MKKLDSLRRTLLFLLGTLFFFPRASLLGAEFYSPIELAAEETEVDELEESGLAPATFGERGELQEDSEDPTSPDYRPPWERLKWTFNGAGFATAQVDRNENYEHAGDVCLAGELALRFPMSARDCFGMGFKMGCGDTLDLNTPTFFEFVDQDLCFAEAWYERKFDCGLRCRTGLLDLTLDGFDTNEFASSGYDHFSSTGFINNLAWDNPGPSFGALVWKDLGDRWTVGAAWQCSDSLVDIFSYGYGMGQLEYHSDFDGRKGNYRFYGWVKNNPYLEKTNVGWGASCDQEISGNWGLWTRFGFQREDASDVSSCVSAGAALFRLRRFWNATDEDGDDSFGLGLGVARASELFRESSESDAGTETFLESYYRFALPPCGHISPYLQYAVRPLGDKDSGSVFVLGVRAGFNL